MVKSTDDFTNYTMRLPTPLWRFLKKMAMNQACPMSDIIINLLVKHKEKIDSKIEKNGEVDY